MRSRFGESVPHGEWLVGPSPKGALLIYKTNSPAYLLRPIAGARAGRAIVRLADIAERLESQRTRNGLELSWQVGTLQQSTNLNGPWVDIPNAVSPLLVPFDQPSAFFRIKVGLE